jgi:hypothetical protein
LGATPAFEEEINIVKMKALLLASCALVLSTAPLTTAKAAAPAGFAGVVGAAYGQSDCDGCESSSDWTLQGSGAFGFGPAFGAEVDVGYRSIEDASLFGLGGSLFFAPTFGRLGATVGYQSTDIDDIDITLDGLTYGAFGEFYAGPMFTLAAKLGGLSVDFDDGITATDSQSGTYIGAAIIGYVMPNLAIQGDVLFSGVSIEDGLGGEEDLDNTTFTIGAEYLVSDMLPVSIFGGYSFGNVEFGSAGDLDTSRWQIGVRFYFGAGGPTLVDKHRNGTLGWVGQTDATSFILP